MEPERDLNLRSLLPTHAALLEFVQAVDHMVQVMIVPVRRRVRADQLRQCTLGRTESSKAPPCISPPLPQQTVQLSTVLSRTTNHGPRITVHESRFFRQPALLDPGGEVRPAFVRGSVVRSEDHRRLRDACSKIEAEVIG